MNLWYDENINRIRYRMRVGITKLTNGTYKAILFNGGYNSSMTQKILRNAPELESAIKNSEIEYRDKQIDKIIQDN